MEEDQNELEILRKQIADGEDAKRLLKHPMIQGFVVAQKGRLLERFNATTFEQDAERMEIWRMTKVVDIFVDSLHEYIDTGKIAIRDQEDIKNGTEGA
jgi:hypothetical protein